MRHDDLLALRQKSVEHVPWIIDDVDVQPQDPVLGAQRRREEVVPALSKHRAAKVLLLGAPVAPREPELVIALEQLDAREQVPGGAESLLQGRVRPIDAVALEHSQREPAGREFEARESREVGLEVRQTVLDGCEDQHRGSARGGGPGRARRDRERRPGRHSLPQAAA